MVLAGLANCPTDDATKRVFKNCYVSVHLNTTDPRGIFTGRATTGFDSCYFNSDLYTASGGRQATPLKTSDFKNSSKFAGWDFQNTWYIDSKTGYPELKFN